MRFDRLDRALKGRAPYPERVMWHGFKEMPELDTYNTAVHPSDLTVAVSVNRRYESSLFLPFYVMMAATDTAQFQLNGTLRHDFRWFKLLLRLDGRVKI